MARGAERALLQTSDLAEQVRPVALAAEQLLPVAAPLAPLLPHGGLVRGTAVVATGLTGPTSLAAALAVEAMAEGSWAVVVGLPTFGLAAAHDLGLPLERLAVVAPPPPETWLTVVAGLLDGFDLVLAAPPPRPGAAGARRLLARLRERGSVLVQVGWPSGCWPERADLALDVEEAHWEGIGAGWGACRRRRVSVAVTGRRGAARPRRGWLWLPDESGRLATAPAPSTAPADAASADTATTSTRPALDLVARPAS